jgi:putative methanogenesis marker protein 3
MISVQLDGERREIREGSTIRDLLPDRDRACCFAVVRKGEGAEEKTRNIQVVTTAGEVVIELSEAGASLLSIPAVTPGLTLGWTDRYAAAFGPFFSEFVPGRKPSLYERGDVVLGCGGYDPARSYIVFSKIRHSADHGAAATGGVIGRVVSGKGVLDRWEPGDRIERAEPVITWADTTRSFTTRDEGLVLEDGMRIVTRIQVMAQGYSKDSVDTTASRSVEHLIHAMRNGQFVVGRSASTFISGERNLSEDVPGELRRARRDGTVTTRTKGRTRGGIYIYIADLPGSPAHTVVGQVVQGIELARLARENDVLCIRVVPARFDLIGLSLEQAFHVAEERRIKVVADDRTEERMVVAQEPGTTLEALARGSVTLRTALLSKVIDIELDDARAPATCEVFRRLTGLQDHAVGQMPFFFNFDDVYLFKPPVPKGVIIVPENLPVGVTDAGVLAMTNDSRKGAGLVGVRLTPNREYGPTSEPFEGTNIIGRVLDLAKLADIKEKELVYIREVRR